MKQISDRLQNRFVDGNLDILGYEEYLEAQQALVQKMSFRRSLMSILLFCAGLFALQVNVILSVFLLALAANLRVSMHFCILWNEIINQNQLLGRLINGQTQNMQVLRKESMGDDKEDGAEDY